MSSKKIRIIITVTLVCLILSGINPIAAQDKDQLIKFKSAIKKDGGALDISTRKEIEHSIQLGLKWLLTQQQDNGSWNNYPAITALALSAYMRAHPNMDASHPDLAVSYEYLKSNIQPDGSITLGDMPSYNTSICLIAFKDAGLPEYDSIIRNAEAFLKQMQLDGSEGFTTDSLYYGGVGYGGDERPDLSNLHWALEAVAYKEPALDVEKKLSKKEAERLEANKLYYDNALHFLARCQNLEGVNPEDYAGDDGGFMYEPGASKAGATRSYGSMTYAGMKSMVFAKVDRNDARVQAAIKWIGENYAVETTPFMNNQGLYYYYQTMAKALKAYGEDFIITTDGKQNNWRLDLANQLLKTQDAEGWWVNDNGRWWENDPVLVTTYCILALEELL